MNVLVIVLIGLSLGMDAFTISICKGLKNSNLRNGLTISLFFSLFQFIMPILGYYLGTIINDKIINYHSYFSAILLIIIGILMIKEDKINELDSRLNFKELILLSIATSIDALMVGISFSFVNINILISSLIIGLITFIMCIIGYYLGNLFYKKAHQYAGIIGGITLIILGIKLLFSSF